MAAALVILSPYIPMFFMGEEFASSSPFYFFVDFADEGLIEAVRKGRKREFKHSHHEGELPDPADLQTFFRSKLNFEEAESKRGKAIYQLYSYLTTLRRREPVLKEIDRERVECSEQSPGLLYIRRWNENESLIMAANFNKEPAQLKLPDARGAELLLDTAAPEYEGPGKGEFSPSIIYRMAPESYVVLKQ